MVDPPTDLTQLLRDEGQRGALYELVYGELHDLARRRLQRERAGHTLQATALVNEAYLRLARDTRMEWRDRRHFFGAAAEAMRRILVDHARAVQAAKRGGGEARLTLTAAGLVGSGDPELLIDLDGALAALEAEDARAAEGARLRLFAGFSTEDVAAALELTPRTVQRDWAYARSRLMRHLDPDETRR